jgi:hypothetical protein
MALIRKRRYCLWLMRVRIFEFDKQRREHPSQLVFKMVFDEQKQLSDSASTEALWTATPAITLAEHKGKMTSLYFVNERVRSRTQSQAPPSGVTGDTTSCITGVEWQETVVVTNGVLSKCAFQSITSRRSRIGLEYDGGRSR